MNHREILQPERFGEAKTKKLWQIILVAFNAFNGMAVYFLIGLASYSASIGYGIATLAVGGLLTFTRIFDAITDPLLAFVYDRFQTPFGKVRPLMLIGWAIQTGGLLCLFNFFSSKGHGVRLADSTQLYHPDGTEHCGLYQINAGIWRKLQSGIPEYCHLAVRDDFLYRCCPCMHRDFCL